METTVTIPTPLFESAEQVAQQLGMSRSQLYSTALSTYLESLKASQVTLALDEIYADETSTLDPVVMNMQLASIPGDEW